MVLAFAGDSTITSFLPFAAGMRGGHHSAGAGSAILAAVDTSSASEPLLLPGGRPVVAVRARPLPLPGVRDRAPPRPRRVRAGGRPRLEFRPLGTRDRDLAPALPALHGEVRAVLVPALRPPERRRCLQGRPGHVRPRGDPD